MNKRNHETIFRRKTDISDGRLSGRKELRTDGAACLSRGNLSEELLLPLSAGLIEGLGTLEGTCGALIGANLVLAIKNKGNPMVQVEAAHLFQDFVERCGASICKDLRGIGKEKPLCSCEDCIKEAIALLY